MLTVSIGGYLLLIAGEPVLIVLAALVAGGCGWAWPGVLSCVVSAARRPAGVGAMAGLFTGAVAGPLAVGVLAQQEQFAIAWAACATFALLAACTVSGVSRTAPRPGRPVPLRP